MYSVTNKLSKNDGVEPAMRGTIEQSNVNFDQTRLATRRAGICAGRRRICESTLIDVGGRAATYREARSVDKLAGTRERGESQAVVARQSIDSTARAILYTPVDLHSI